MPIDQPMPFREAVDFLLKKGIMPTDMTTAELRGLAAAIRKQSFFSAQNYIEGALLEMKDAVESVVNPRQMRREDRVSEANPEGWVTEGFNPAQAREVIRDYFRKIGYQAPEGKAGTIEDLGSDRRIDLVVRTNVDLARGYGQTRQGMSPGALKLFPAQELFRLEDRKMKREWMERWQTAGAATGLELGDGWCVQDERMVALKGHPIWEELGSSDNFDDALDVDYPPFAFNSGMWVMDVDRRTAEGMGILGEGEAVTGKKVGFRVMDPTGPTGPTGGAA